jgi:dihydrolipoamide dehydrogenase
MKTLVLEDGLKISAEEVLVGAGRFADLSGLGLEKLGLKWDRKGTKVNGHMRTELENIYAAGDINGISPLAHSASRQGEIAADNIMGAKRVFDESIVPKCVYTWPEVGTVGLNKTQAEAKGLAVKTSRAYFLGIGKAVTHDETEGFAQIVYDAADETILGAQIAGGSATELIHILAVAVKLKLKRHDMREIIYAHPTMAEVIHEALNK